MWPRLPSFPAFPTPMTVQAANVVVPTLTGRAGVSQQSKIYQFLAQIVDAAGVFQAPDNNILPQGWQRDYQPQAAQGDGLAPRNHLCERLFRLGTSSQVVYRAAPVVPVNALTPVQFDSFETGSPLPDPTAATGGSCYFRVRVRASAARGKYVFFMDVDETIELYAFSAQMELVGPPGAVEITDRNDSQSVTPVTAVGEVVIDARIGAVLSPIEQPTGLKEVKFTQIVPVAQSASIQIPVPRFAREVRIMQDSVGAVSGPWFRVTGGLTTPLNVGVLNFRARNIEESEVNLGRESALVTDTNGANDRLFQLQWTIRP